ncbi:MAG: T9SS type A sorting domain-containing protein, partial [bacterium]
VVPFMQEVIDIETEPSGSGTFLHSQFQLRLTNLGGASPITVNDDWFIDNIYFGLPAPLLSIPGDSLSFGLTQLDSTSVRDLVITNLGIDTLAVSEILSSNNEFLVIPTTFILSGGSQEVLQISFTPTQPGVRTGWLDLISNDPLRDTVKVYLSGVGEGITGLEETALPRSFMVYQNYPNPFNPTTSINYELPQNTRVQIVIYNLLGQRVKTLLNSYIKAGRHYVDWDGRNDQGYQLSSGIYIYRFESKEYSKTLKMILLK